MTEAFRVEEFFYGKCDKCNKREIRVDTKKLFFFMNIIYVAATLEKKGTSTTWTQWEPDQRLQLRQVLLAHTAKPDEFNVVEVTTIANQQFPIKNIFEFV